MINRTWPGSVTQSIRETLTDVMLQRRQRDSMRRVASHALRAYTCNVRIMHYSRLDYNDNDRNNDRDGSEERREGDDGPADSSENC